MPPSTWWRRISTRHEVAVTLNKHPRYEIRARNGYQGRGKIAAPEVAR
jgi:hypothetical protein